jgi:hypothetical protein
MLLLNMTDKAKGTPYRHWHKMCKEKPAVVHLMILMVAVFDKAAQLFMLVS